MKLDLTIALCKVKQASFIPYIIGKWTKSNFYHVELILDNKWITSDIDYGVVIRDSEPLNEDWVYVTLNNVEVTDEQYELIFEWIKQQQNKKYDHLGIVYSQVLPFRYDDKNKWFCSELVIKILQLFLIKEVIDLTPNLVSPGDIAKIFKIE